MLRKRVVVSVLTLLLAIGGLLGVQTAQAAANDPRLIIKDATTGAIVCDAKYGTATANACLGGATGFLPLLDGHRYEIYLREQTGDLPWPATYNYMWGQINLATSTGYGDFWLFEFKGYSRNGTGDPCTFTNNSNSIVLTCDATSPSSNLMNYQVISAVADVGTCYPPDCPLPPPHDSTAKFRQSGGSIKTLNFRWVTVPCWPYPAPGNPCP